MNSMLSNLKNTHLAWIRYRDLWTELIHLHRSTGFTDDQRIIVSIKTLLTKERTEELKYDPVSPD